MTWKGVREMWSCWDPTDVVDACAPDSQVRSRTSGTSYWLKAQTPLYVSQSRVSNPQRTPLVT
jgi:hypothetical protein